MIEDSASVKASDAILELNVDQRMLLATETADFGNLAAGALGFGQFVGDTHWSVPTVIVGVGIWVGCLGFAVRLTKEGR